MLEKDQMVDNNFHLTFEVQKKIYLIFFKFYFLISLSLFNAVPCIK